MGVAEYDVVVVIRKVVEVIRKVVVVIRKVVVVEVAVPQWLR